MGKNLIGPYITDEVLESQYRREGSSIWVFFFYYYLAMWLISTILWWLLLICKTRIET